MLNIIFSFSMIILGIVVVMVGSENIMNEIYKKKASVDKDVVEYQDGNVITKRLFVKGYVEWESEVNASVDWSGNTVKIKIREPNKQREK